MISAAAILNARILIVDDLKANIQLLTRILAAASYTRVDSSMDPREVGELHRKDPYDLILLDLQMPGMDGFQVMHELKKIEPDGYLPVIVVTAQPAHKMRALLEGAKDFISKPFELSEVLARVHNMLETRLLHKALHESNDLLETRVRERTAELQSSYLETIFTMTRAAEFKDEDTGAHVQRISHYSGALARLMGMDTALVDALFFASPMHDIGKIGIPDRVLLKPGRLSAEEWAIMKSHTSMGAKILGRSKSRYLELGAVVALNHHERWDGSGYPNGIRGEAIPQAARIVQLCDIYDALRSKRPYKDGYDHARTVDIMLRGDERTRPAHFDPVVLAAFGSRHPVFADIFDAPAA